MPTRQGYTGGTGRKLNGIPADIVPAVRSDDEDREDEGATEPGAEQDEGPHRQRPEVRDLLDDLRLEAATAGSAGLSPLLTRTDPAAKRSRPVGSNMRHL